MCTPSFPSVDASRYVSWIKGDDASLMLACAYIRRTHTISDGRKWDERFNLPRNMAMGVFNRAADGQLHPVGSLTDKLLHA